jgi:hypothetical protein
MLKNQIVAGGKVYDVPPIFQFYKFNDSHHVHLTTPELRKSKLLLNCDLCDKQITASVTVPSNFISHIRVRHQTQFEQYESTRTPKRKLNVNEKNTPSKITTVFQSNKK